MYSHMYSIIFFYTSLRFFDVQGTYVRMCTAVTAVDFVTYPKYIGVNRFEVFLYFIFPLGSLHVHITEYVMSVSQFYQLYIKIISIFVHISVLKEYVG